MNYEDVREGVNKAKGVTLKCRVGAGVDSRVLGDSGNGHRGREGLREGGGRGQTCLQGRG